MAEVPFWDCARVTVICSDEVSRRSDFGALGAETAVDLGRAPVW